MRIFALPKNLNFLVLALMLGSLILAAFTAVTVGTAIAPQIAQAASASCTNLFKTPVTTTTGTNSNPNSVAFGDLNNDGKTDIVVTTFTTGNLIPYLGDGQGGYTRSSTPVFGNLTNPRLVKIGNFKGDGSQIPVVADSQGLTFYLITSYQGQTFYYGTRYNFSSGVGVFAVGDFNKDGKTDIAVAVNGQVEVLLSDGSLTIGTSNSGFAAPVFYPLPNGSSGLSIGDVNGDGNLDVVSVSSSNPAVSVFLGDGTGKFGNSTDYPVSGSYPLNLALADLNGDGKLDVITALRNDKKLVVLLNKGDGRLNSPGYYPVNADGVPGFIATGDFNGDGKIDVAVNDAVSNSDKVNILFNRGDGYFGPSAPISAGGNAPNVFSSDLNNDGKPDLVTANLFSDTFSVLLGNVLQAQTALSVVAPTTGYTGKSTTVTVALADSCTGLLKRDYTGTVHFSSTDSAASLPADYTFTPADHGIHTFSVILNTAGSQAITATDTTTNMLTSAASLTVADPSSCTNYQTVNSLADDGTCGTLRAAVSLATANDTINIAIPTANKTMILIEPLVINKALTINGSGCTNGQPADSLIAAAGLDTGGLVLNGGVQLNNLKIGSFSNPQILVRGGANKLKCTIVSRN